MGAFVTDKAYLPAIQREWVRQAGLRAFVKVAWNRVDPAQYVHSKHIDVVCDHLEAVYRGDIRNLLINLPPGMSKSSLVNVLGPLYAWILDPSLRWIFGSNDPALANRDADRVRNVISSPWWSKRWPHVAIDKHSDAVGNYYTTAMGRRISVGIGTRLIGQHADIKVVDDPNKPLGLEGPVKASRRDLDRPIEWYTGTLSGRNVDIKTTRTIIIMQRLHERDLSGFILDAMKDGLGQRFEHLCLPMEFDKKNRCVTSIGGDWRQEDGELLCPERVDHEALKLLKQSYNNNQRYIEAQLGQRPSPKGGNIIKSHWLRHWGPCSPKCETRGCPGPVWPSCPPEEQMRLESSWDLAFDGDDNSSFVVGQKWGRWNGFLVLLDQKRDQWTFLQTLKVFEQSAKDWPRAFRKLVENKANGPALENVLKAKVPGIKLVNPQGSKEERLEACEELYESGVVVYPSPLLHPWVEQVNFHEILAMPTGANDDTVDATTQYLKPFTEGDRAKKLAAANQGAREFFGHIT